MALRARGRTSGGVAGVGVAPRAVTSDTLLDDISHELKLIDIKRRAILETSARLPLYYVVTGVFGLLLAGAVLNISILFIFIFGALFSAALANVVGPTGALTMRRRAYAEIASCKERLFPLLPKLPENVAPVLVGVAKVSKTSLQFTEKQLAFRNLSEPDIDPSGALPLGPYKYLAFVFRGPDGTVDLKHPALRKQYWLTAARQKGQDEAAIQKALNAVV